MKRKLPILFLLLLITGKIFSQGIELYGGYPMRIPVKSAEYKVRNWNNGQAGLNVNIYIRSVFVQFGAGYTSNNYKLNYDPSLPYSTLASATVFHQYVYFPFMVYPKLYADGKNVISIGAGANLMFPINKFKTHFTYIDGTRAVIKTSGNYKIIAMPRISIRYSRWLGKSFMFFSDIYSDFTVMNPYENNPKYNTPTYYSRATIGINAGVGYFLPIDHGLKKPRYFEKWLKRARE